MKILSVFSVLIVFFGLSLAAQATTLIDVSCPGGPVGCGWSFYGYTVVKASGFSLAGAFSNVAIEADLDPGGLNIVAGHAFLTTQIGPGTSASNQVADSIFSTVNPSGLTTLFSGLTLGAGNYYLVLAKDQLSSGGDYLSSWLFGNPGVVNIASGTTYLGSLYSSDADVSHVYAPASDFSNMVDISTGGPFNHLFRVSSSALTPVPEPTTMLLLGSGLIGLAGYGRKKFFKK